MFSAVKGAVGVNMAHEVVHTFGSFCDIQASTIDNEPVSLSKYAGKVVIVANVACF